MSPGARRWLAAPMVGLLAVLAPLGAQSAPASPTPARADTAALRRTLDGLVAAHRGVVGYAIHNLDTGERVERDADSPYPTASLIKVPIAVTVLEQVAAGQLSLTDPLTVLRIDKVPGAGILQHLHDGMTITVRDALWLMLTLSDNTATNLLLSRVELRRVWESMERRGLPRTKVHSKVFLRLASVAPDSSARYGLGVSTPREMATLFAQLAAGRVVSPSADSLLLDMLAHNEDGELLQRHVTGLTVPHKTGATDAVRTECAIFPLRGRVVACVFTRDNEDQRWVLDSAPQVLLGAMGRAVVAAWSERAR